MTVLQYAPSLQGEGNFPSSVKRPVGLSACPGKDTHGLNRHPDLHPADTGWPVSSH